MSEHGADNVGTEQCFRAMGSGHRLISTAWGKPGAMLMCAGGFAFYGDQAWFNERVFWVDTDRVCAKLASMYRDERFYSTLPGQTFWMEGNRLARIEESTPFLASSPRAQWPARGRRLRAEVPDYSPATGRRELNSDDDVLLREGLDRLAVALVGGFLFRSLHSILVRMAARATPKSSDCLITPAAAAGVPAPVARATSTVVPTLTADPRQEYLAGWECWATDLIAVLQRELGPIALMFGRARLWNHLTHRFRFDLQEGLSRVSHPLSSPGGYLPMYRRMWEKNRFIVPTIRANAVH
jgi:hypothetical protein